MARPLPARSHDGRGLPVGVGDMAREGVVGRSGPGRPGRRRRHDRSGVGGVDGAAGGVEDGARARGLVRRQDASEAVRLARLLPPLLRRARRSAPALLDAQSRSAGACSGSPSRSRSSIAARSSEAFHSSTRCSPICSHAVCGSGSVGAGFRCRPSGRRGRWLPRPCSCSDSVSGSISRPPAA